MHKEPFAQIPLGNLSEIDRGISWDISQECGDSVRGSLPVLRIPNVKSTLVTDDLVYLKVPNRRSVQRWIAQPGSLIMVGSNGNAERVGNVAFVDTDQEFLFASFLFGIKPSKGVDPRYLYHCLASPEVQDRMTRSVQGTTGLKNLSKTYVKGLLIPVPPIRDQQGIAEILDAVAKRLLSTELIIAKLSQIRQGLLYDLLTRGTHSSGRLRADSTSAPSLYKDSQLGQIPIDWTVHLLDDVAIRGSGHTPNKDVSAYWNGGVKWVSLADSARLDRIYISETDKEISDLGIANSSTVKHRAGTVILSRDAGVGKSAILAREMAVSQHFMAWACGESLDNRYLYYWLQFMKPHFEAIAMGSTIKTIGLPFFRRLLIALPPIDQQRTAAAQLLAVDADIARHRAEVQKQWLLKQGLMDDLLTGRVRVGALG